MFWLARISWSVFSFFKVLFNFSRHSPALDFFSSSVFFYLSVRIVAIRSFKQVTFAAFSFSTAVKNCSFWWPSTSTYLSRSCYLADYTSKTYLISYGSFACLLFSLLASMIAMFSTMVLEAGRPKANSRVSITEGSDRLASKFWSVLKYDIFLQILLNLLLTGLFHWSLLLDLQMVIGNAWTSVLPFIFWRPSCVSSRYVFNSPFFWIQRLIANNMLFQVCICCCDIIWNSITQLKRLEYFLALVGMTF